VRGEGIFCRFIVSCGGIDYGRVRGVSLPVYIPACGCAARCCVYRAGNFCDMAFGKIHNFYLG